MPRIHMLEIEFRDIPETYSPIQIQESKIQHCQSIITALFRCVGLMSFDQAHLHHGQVGNALEISARLDEYNTALELFGELGAAVSDYASGAVEELAELVTADAVSEQPAKN